MNMRVRTSELTHLQLREFETTMSLREPERKLQQEGGHLHARTSTSIKRHARKQPGLRSDHGDTGSMVLTDLNKLQERERL